VAGLAAGAGGCGGAPRPGPPAGAVAARPAARPPLRPLATAELQEVFDGAARLNRQCRDRRSETGLYLVRAIIAPDGRVRRAEPRLAPRRSEDPASFVGVPRYLEGGLDPDTEVVRCFAAAFARLRFRPFAGDTIAFDYPIAVENLPPPEAESAARRCATDDDCVFRPRPRCGCPPCGPTWRLAVNRRAAEALARARSRRTCPRAGRCPTCAEPAVLLGARALCIDGQCTTR
jgi:hypothetical protein